MNFRRQNRPEALSFQIAPMIDVVFLLLCFFITSQVFSQWETEIDIALPTAKTGEVPQRLPGELIINILADGRTVISGQEQPEDRLGPLLKRLSGFFPGQPIIIRADQKTPYQHVIRVLDLCRQADIWNISFATSVPEE
ncbi:MAG TPA: biopolymer transporter ExbD [Kiritimatiellia bacterium]|jgi:biopolymer transport protein ExbD|nr:biopolymer transporter ExbD [Kiritimatiellia bacterium]HNS80312.1 biopolymer transporter ExbD [Kiritimatiellia bacterium]HPA77222.1 biopolymer transporter ExbD [Kiritimatiellia bacterium]HQQ04564.1 biopolymer transporter ExbD [Kiritimatiellia bacterium]